MRCRTPSALAANRFPNAITAQVRRLTTMRREPNVGEKTSMPIPSRDRYFHVENYRNAEQPWRVSGRTELPHVVRDRRKMRRHPLRRARAAIASNADCLNAWELREVRRTGRPNEKRCRYAIRPQLFEHVGRTRKIVAVEAVEDLHSLSPEEFERCCQLRTVRRIRRQRDAFRRRLPRLLQAADTGGYAHGCPRMPPPHA